MPLSLLARHTSHHSSHSRPRAPSSGFMTREEYELEETRRELEELKVNQGRKRDEWELNQTKRLVWQDIQNVYAEYQKIMEERS